MRIRTLALVLALASGAAGLAEASTAKRAVVHRSARKAVVRKGNSRMVKGRKAPRPKVVKH
ncbi:MAG TPA: hypothetical protein VMH81_29880 [Bryobacteraceae bacterium]|nr:hypothetical protein [Bryobacteraceae bacterium]